MSNKTILIVFMHNPNSITSNAHNKAKAKSYARNGDPRFAALMSIAVALRQRSHNVLVEVAGGLSVRPAIAQSLLKGFTWADDAAIQRFGKPSLCIAWFAYFADKGTRRNPMVRRLLKDPTIPRLWYENGMTKGSVTVDPKGFLAESFYVESLNWRVQQHYNERACASHVKQHLEDDSSKRPQQARVDVPTSMLHRYVFVPTQKFDDLSVVRYSRISYPQLLDGAAAFCAAHNLSLVIKIHPHLRGEQLAGQQRRIRRLQARYPAVLESRASINFLTTNALFTVTLNGGTLMDNVSAKRAATRAAPSIDIDHACILSLPSVLEPCLEPWALGLFGLR